MPISFLYVFKRFVKVVTVKMPAAALYLTALITIKELGRINRVNASSAEGLKIISNSVSFSLMNFIHFGKGVFQSLAYCSIITLNLIMITA